MTDPGASATAWHQEQRQRIASHQTKKPEMPSNHNCPGGQCTQPVPPLPAGSVDTFCSGDCSSQVITANPWIIGGALILAAIFAMSLRRRRVK
jgi:hypothetical protein